MTWMMMGSKDGGELKKPKEKTVFVEDMAEPDLAKIVHTLRYWGELTLHRLSYPRDSKITAILAT